MEKTVSIKSLYSRVIVLARSEDEYVCKTPKIIGGGENRLFVLPFNNFSGYGNTECEALTNAYTTFYLAQNILIGELKISALYEKMPYVLGTIITPAVKKELGLQAVIQAGFAVLIR